MKCSKCGAEFEAKFCPECGTPANGQPPVQQAQSQPPIQPQASQYPAYQNPVVPQKKKGGCLKGGLIVIGVIIVISIIASIAGGGKSSSSSTTADSTTATSTQTKAADSEAASAPATSAADKSTSYGIGQPATANDVTMTLVSVKESKGSEYNKPADGKVFLLCEFNIDNKSTKDLAISSMASFEAYVDGYSTTQSIAGLLEKGSKNQLDGNVASGKKMNGIIAYEVPKNWKEIEIQLNPDVFSFFSGKTIFKATKK